jgi:hydroxymethylglutaryl-CoA lyase
MATYPASATLCDVGPRDGFQFESVPIPTALKLAAIRALAAAGVPRIQATSFVHPKWVPQMADAEEVAAALLEEPGAEGVVYTGLALNVRGVDRAAASGLKVVDLSIATNETHARANVNMSVREGVAAAEAMLERAAQHGLKAQLGFQTVFGYAEPGDTPLAEIVALAERFAGAGLESLSLADSTGMANPAMIKERVAAVREAAPGVPLVLHLHDTRGLGLANVVAGLEAGVAWFDTSLGGLGGCPFIPGATGNIATEDTAYLLESLGVATGIDRDAVAEATLRLEQHLGRELPGKMHRLYAKAAAQ